MSVSLSRSYRTSSQRMLFDVSIHRTMHRTHTYLQYQISQNDFMATAIDADNIDNWLLRVPPEGNLTNLPLHTPRWIHKCFFLLLLHCRCLGSPISYVCECLFSKTRNVIVLSCNFASQNMCVFLGCVGCVRWPWIKWQARGAYITYNIHIIRSNVMHAPAASGTNSEANRVCWKLSEMQTFISFSDHFHLVICSVRIVIWRCIVYDVRYVREWKAYSPEAAWPTELLWNGRRFVFTTFLYFRIRFVEHRVSRDGQYDDCVVGS